IFQMIMEFRMLIHIHYLPYMLIEIFRYLLMQIVSYCLLIGNQEGKEQRFFMIISGFGLFRHLLLLHQGLRLLPQIVEEYSLENISFYRQIGAINGLKFRQLIMRDK